MNRKGFEALADGTMLLTVLLVASTLSLALAGAPSSLPAEEAARYAEDTLVALFRTTLDGLAFTQDGREVHLPNGTQVDAFLRLQVHLASRTSRNFDFHAANERVTEIATALVRVGWSYVLVGGVSNGAALLQLPEGVVLPESYAASSWSYPSLDGSGPDTVLRVLVWLSPRR